MDRTHSGFQTCEQKGFHITYKNGWTISVQFGRGNYSSNYDWQGDNVDDFSSPYTSKAPKSRTAEVAIWANGGNFIEFPDGDTIGNRWTPEMVLYIQNKIAHLKDNENPDFSDWPKS